MKLCEGKYEFYKENHSVHCKRYGEVWRDFIGDGAVLALFDYAEDLEEKVKRLEDRLEDERGRYQEMINR